MAALRVSLAFLEESVQTVIKKGGLIAAAMSGNEVYKNSPISAAGLKTALDQLKLLEKKAQNGHSRDMENRDVALEDVVDFIQQIADFINHSSDPRRLDGQGFEFTTEPQKSLDVKRLNWSGGLM